MFDLCRRSARVEIRSAEEFTAIRLGLEEKEYAAVVRSMENAVCSSLGIQKGTFSLAPVLADRRMYTGNRGERPLGEIFVRDDSLYILIPSGGSLSAWELRSHTNPPQIDRFLSDLEAVIRQRLDGRRVRGMDFSWREERNPISQRSRLARSRISNRSGNKLNTKEANYTETELVCSELISERANRDFLIELAKVGNKARSIDASSLLDDTSREALLTAGIIKKEYLLVCRQDSRTICSIPDRDKLEKTIGSEIACTSCGRAFTDEIIQDIYALTPEARDLLAGSQWMTLWVTSQLVAAGVPIESIKWNAASGDDELDIVADIHGLKVFFELKDREFGLGDAYPFSFRVERYGGDVGVVVTMDRMADEAQKFLEEQRRRAPTAAWVIEGEKQDVPKEIASMVGSLSKLAVHHSVMGGEERFGIDIWPFLGRWMKRYE